MTKGKTIIKSFSNFLVNYFKDIPEDEIVLLYEGEINHEIILSFTNIVEKQLILINEKNLIRKKVFNILIESLQNIFNHGNLKKVSDNFVPGKGIIMVNNNAKYYKITTGNLISNEGVEKIKPILIEVNKCDENTIRDLYKKQLEEGRFSAKGGAGLGFIDMARKSGQKLDFEFIKIDSKLSFFIISFQINK